MPLFFTIRRVSQISMQSPARVARIRKPNLMTALWATHKQLAGQAVGIGLERQRQLACQRRRQVGLERAKIGLARIGGDGREHQATGRIGSMDLIDAWLGRVVNAGLCFSPGSNNRGPGQGSAGTGDTQSLNARSRRRLRSITIGSPGEFERSAADALAR